MSLLRILKNFSGLTPRPLAAGSSCPPVGSICNSTAQCTLGSKYCIFRVCSRITHRCCIGWPHQVCTSNTQCCSNLCNGGVCA
jgi:hypothetical protein